MIVFHRWMVCGFAWLFAASIISGCGGERSDLGEVTGTITLDGQPLSNAQIQFVPNGGVGSTAYGKTDSNGHYSMMFSRDASGASLGENGVRISTADVGEQDGEEVVIKEQVPPKYNSETELVADVQSGANIFDFALESGGNEIAQPEIADDEADNP